MKNKYPRGRFEGTSVWQGAWAATEIHGLFEGSHWGRWIKVWSACSPILTHGGRGSITIASHHSGHSCLRDITLLYKVSWESLEHGLSFTSQSRSPWDFIERFLVSPRKPGCGRKNSLKLIFNSSFLDTFPGMDKAWYWDLDWQMKPQ